MNSVVPFSPGYLVALRSSTLNTSHNNPKQSVQRFSQIKLQSSIQQEDINKIVIWSTPWVHCKLCRKSEWFYQNLFFSFLTWNDAKSQGFQSDVIDLQYWVLQVTLYKCKKCQSWQTFIKTRETLNRCWTTDWLSHDSEYICYFPNPLSISFFISCHLLK